VIKRRISTLVLTLAGAVSAYAADILGAAYDPLGTLQ
jgi:hypothetical protein